MSSTHSLSRAQGHASFVSRAAGHSLSSSSSSLFPAFGSTSSSASRLLADSTACGINGSGFEDDDGNLAVDDTTDGCTDWNSFGTPTWTGTAPYQTATASSGAFNFVGISDATGGNDTSYKDGTKQADTCPAVDQAGSTPNKDDLARIYIAGERIDNHPYLFLAWVRAPQNTINSDLHVAFEFNQSQVACSNGDGLVQRTPGDLLVGYEFQSATPTITLATWTGTTWSAATTLPPAVAEAAVNTTAGVTDGIKPTGAPDPAQDEFGEAGIDIGALITAGGGRPCETFGTVSGASRTSGSSTSSNMEDLVGPAPIDISNCATPTIATQTTVTSMNIGDTQTVGDTATLTDGNSPTGDVSFQLYSDAACTVPVAGVSGSAAIVNGVATFAGSSFTPTAAGTYFWGVSYPGDGLNNAASSCGGANEELTVAPNTPSIVTAASSATIGAAVDDVATLSGATDDAGGTITFNLYGPSDTPNCSGTAVYTNTVDVSGNSDYNSGDFTPTTAGSYYWIASYSGDTNNLPATGSCGDDGETSTIDKQPTSIVTAASSATIGAAVDDVATLSGATDDAGGTITFNLYGPSDTPNCSGTAVYTNTVDVSGNSDYNSGDFTPTTAGSYYWIASYSGDTNNLPATGSCGDDGETSTIDKQPTSIVTAASSATIGAAVDDVATLSGATDDAGGTITFNLYGPSDTPNCSGTAVYTNTVDVSGNSDYNSGDFTPTTAGSYYWIASYSGDTNNLSATGSCGDDGETSTLGQQPTSIGTAATSGLDGDAIHDVATLSGATDDAGGTITFNLYGPSDTPNCSGTAVYTNTVDVDGNSDYNSGDFTPTTAGNYYWIASYSGDTNNAPSSGSCGDLGETSTIGKQPTSIGTAATSATIGAAVDDVATLSGATDDAGGTITFSLYGPSDTPNCSGTAVYTNTVDVDGNSDYNSGDFTPTTAGNYYWIASYSGDTNNLSATGSCGDDGETSTLGQQPTSIATAATSGSNGDAIHDVATLSGGINVPQGTITFNLYGPSASPNCSGTVVYTNTVEVDGNSDYNSGDFTPTTAGNYYWIASYSGDTNNQPSSGSCGDEGETSTISPATIKIMKTADAPVVNVGGQIGFTMTVFNPGDGDAHGVKLNDTLPTAPGVSWSIDKQGAGWAGSCVIAAGVLTCGGSDGVTVPGDTTRAASTYTVHIVSGTTGATGGDCPTSGVINNTAHVTSNDGSAPASDSTCVQAMVDLSVTKIGTPTPVSEGANITWTMVVTNNGPSTDTGVKVTDPLPAGTSFVSVSVPAPAACTGGAIVSCNLGTMTAGQSITITLVTTATAVETVTNTVTVSGNRPETNTSNNTATASVVVNGFPSPPVFCVAVSKVTPKQLFVGRKTMLTIHLTKNKKAVRGVHVRIKGPKLNIKTKASNSKGVVKQTVKMKKAGVLIFTPIAGKTCNTKRVGVTNVFTPPVTG